MHIDTTEIAAVTAASDIGRFDAYATIHKALRKAMAELLVQTGNLDCGDAAAVQRQCDELNVFVEFCFGHLEHENDFIHPALEARAPGGSLRIAGEHLQHERDLTELRSRIDALAGAPAPHRPAAAHALYHALSLFVAHNLVHMYIEETVHNRLLWDHYSDAELIGIHDRLIATIPPQEMAYAMRWMIPAMNPAERTATFAAMKASAPAEAFEGMLQMARSLLDDAAWVALARSLGYPLNRDIAFPAGGQARDEMIAAGALS